MNNGENNIRMVFPALYRDTVLALLVARLTNDGDVD